MTQQPGGTPVVTVAHLVARAERQAADDAQAYYDVEAGLARFKRWLTEESSPTESEAPPPSRRGSSERPLMEVRFLTVVEAAAVMRVTKMTVYRLVHSGELPCIRAGRSFRIPEPAVHDYLRDVFNKDQAL